MTKENLIKILNQHSCLKATDMSADDKKKLYSIMERYGATQSTTYNRFFDKGFDLWELRGIDLCKKLFIRENVPADDKELSDHLFSVGSGFYTELPFMSGLKSNLVNYMASLGMEHRNTVCKRFDADDWKQWERVGILAIIEEFYAKTEEKATA